MPQSNNDAQLELFVQARANANRASERIKSFQAIPGFEALDSGMTLIASTYAEIEAFRVIDENASGETSAKAASTPL